MRQGGDPNSNPTATHFASSSEHLQTMFLHDHQELYGHAARPLHSGVPLSTVISLMLRSWTKTGLLTC